MTNGTFVPVANPKLFVVDTALYHTDNGRVVCGKHCGQTARYTGRDLSGQKIARVTAADGAEWLGAMGMGAPIQCEVCRLTLDGTIAPVANDGEDADHDVCVTCGDIFASTEHPADGFVCPGCLAKIVPPVAPVRATTAQVAAAIALIDQHVADQPRLTADQRAEHERLQKRLQRADCDNRKRPTEKTAAKVAKVRAEISAFAAPFIAHYPAPPARILQTTRSPWGRNGVGTYGVDHGVHDIMVEMVLDGLELSGPQYRTVRCVSDMGGPPVNPRGPCTSMGVAWFAIADQIKRGAIVPYTGDEVADRSTMLTAIAQTEAPTEILTLKVDVTRLSADQRAALLMELTVQCEGSDDHPDVTVLGHTITKGFRRV